MRRGEAPKSNPMTLRTFRSILVMALAFFVLVPALTSCTKEKPTRVVVTVKDADGAPVPGAVVKLYANPAFPLGDPTRLNKENSTNASGRAEFDYSEFYQQGQSGFAVLDILCTFENLTGQGIIKVREEELNEETVVIE